MSLEKVLRLAGSAPSAPPADDLDAELVLAVRTAVREIPVLLAQAGDDSDDDGDDDSSGKGDTDDDSEGGGHSGHGTFKALIKKGVKPAMAAKMCAKADNKVKASALAEAADVILAGLFEWDEAPGQPSSDLDRVVALAAPPGQSEPGRRLLAARAAAAAVLELSSGKMSGTAAQSHPPFHGVHSHMHVHSGDNMHGPGPDRIPGHGAY